MWTLVWLVAAYVIGTISGAYWHHKTLRARFMRVSSMVLEQIAKGNVKDGKYRASFDGEGIDPNTVTFSGGDEDVGC